MTTTRKRERERKRKREIFEKHTKNEETRFVCVRVYRERIPHKKKKAKRTALFLYLVPRRDRVFDDRDVLLFRLLSLFVVRHDYVLFESERVRNQKKRIRKVENHTSRKERKNSRVESFSPNQLYKIKQVRITRCERKADRER